MPGLSFNKVSLFLHIYENQSYSENWQLSGVLTNYCSIPEENEDLRVLSPVSQWIMNWLTYTSTAFNLKKKIKRQENLGINQPSPEDTEQRWKLADFFEFSHCD